MKRRWTFPLFVVFGIGFAVAALSAAWVATQSLGSKLNQLKLKSAIRSAVAKANQPSDEECRAFANKVEHAFASGKVSAIDALFDWDAIFEEAMRAIELPADTRRRMSLSFQKGIRSENALNHRLAREIAKGGELKLLRVREVGGQKVILFRFLFAEGAGVNYLEFVLDRRQDGTVLAADLYSYLNSEFTSQRFREFILLLLAEQPRSVLEKAFSSPADREYAQDITDFGRFMNAVTAGHNEAGLNYYQGLHESTKKRKNVQYYHCLAAEDLDEKGYLAAIEQFKALFPDDPSIEFLRLDYYKATEDYPKVIAAIDHIDKLLGGDPYLNVFRANISIQSEDYPAARRFALQAIEQEPGLHQAYESLIAVAIAENKHGETLELLKKYDETFKFGLDNLVDEDIYTEFRNSPQYAQWLAYIKERDGK